MIITYLGNTNDFFQDAFFNSNTQGFDVTVVSTAADSVVVRNPATNYVTTFTGTGLSGAPDYTGTMTGLSTVDASGAAVVTFTDFSWGFSAFVNALSDAIDNSDNTALDALLALQDITFDGRNANAPAEMGFQGIDTNVTMLGTAFGDTLSGADGNDSIAPGGAPDGDGDVVLGTPGSDSIDFTGHGAGSWADLLYASLSGGITATLDGTANTLTVGKGTLGTDTVTAAQSVLQGDGLTLGGTTHADTFTVDGGTGSWLGLSGGGGNDTFNITLSGVVRLIFGWDINGTNSSGVVANLAAGTISDDGQGGSDTITLTENGGRLEIMATDFNDSVTGAAGDERFIMGAGTDLLDGGDGFDTARYDRSDVQTGITANLDTGLIEGSWGAGNPQSFSHFVSNIEAVSGSDTGNDTMSGSAAGDTFYGNGGGDVLSGLDGNDLLFGGAGDDSLNAGDNTGFDVADAGSGNDTIDAGDMSTGTLLVQHLQLATSTAQTIDINATSATIDKGSDGITTLQNAATAMTAGGLAITGSNLNDSFAVTVTEDGEAELLGGRGNDSFALGTSSTGTVRLNFRYDALGSQADQGVALDLSAGTVSNDGFGDQDTITGVGQTFVEVTGGQQADSLTGSTYADAFLTSGGNDTIDGGTGTDGVSYNQTEMSTGIRADLDAGSVTGTWDGTAFAQSLTSIETLGGTDAHGDVIAGSLASETLAGLGGDDRLFGDGFPVGSAATEARQVYRMYQATLDRAPDGAGFASWTQSLDEGRITIQEAATGFVGSQEFQNTYGALDDAGFVTLLYNNVLGRAPDAAEVNAWLSSMAGGTTRAGVVVGFSESTEFQNNTNAAAQTFADGQTPSLWADDVFRLYQATLGRAPDLAGFLGWAENLGSGSSYDSVATGFVASVEFQNTYGALDDTGFVTLLYNNVLGRDPDADGLAGWTGQLAGGATRETVVQGFAQSQEFINATTDSLKSWVRSQGYHDELEGGAGTNLLSGGILADRFIFDTEDGGTHTVLDLEAWDLLAFQNFGYATAADARSHMAQQDTDVLFTDQGVTITLENTTLAAIADDMIQI